MPENQTIFITCHMQFIIFVLLFLHSSNIVPRKVLIDRFESTPEPDEPLQFDELEPEQDELYDDDQFYKETDIGPAPKLQGDPSKKTLKTLEGPIYSVTSSIGPPQRNRDDTSLEGELDEIIIKYLHKKLLAPQTPKTN